MPDVPRSHGLDRIDCAIVRTLGQTGRRSFAEIGAAIGLSPTSVAERVHRLERSGVIEGYHASVSAEKLGYHLTALILARPVGSDKRFAKLVEEQPEILQCHRVTGDVSFVAYAAVADVTHLERLLNRLEPAASYIQTLLILSTAFVRPIAELASAD